MEYKVININGDWVALTNPNIEKTWGGIVYTTIDTTQDQKLTHVFGLCKTYMNGNQLYTTYTFSCKPFTNVGSVGLSKVFHVPVVSNLEF